MHKVRAAALIDPYWLLGRSARPDESLLRALRKAAGQGVRLERVYWYLEDQESAQSAGQHVARVTQRPVARDALDDGFELLRAMDEDLRWLVRSGAYEAIVLVSLDDRLALSVEWAKSHGVLLLGCQHGAGEEGDQRMLALFDELLTPVLEPGEVAEVAVSDQVAQVIEATITQWHRQATAEDIERTRSFISSHRGLPRPVDSRVLFLASQQVGRELSDTERLTLRRVFREKFGQSR